MRRDSTPRLAKASLIAHGIAWLPILALLLNDPFAEKPTNEIQGWAAMGSFFAAVGLGALFAVAGTVLAVIALRRRPRDRVALTGLLLNGLPLLGVLGVVLWFFATVYRW